MNRGPATHSMGYSMADMNNMLPYNASTGQMVFYPQPGPIDYSHPHAGMNMATDHMGRMSVHDTPHGRMALPMSGGPQVVMMNHGRYTPSPATDDGMFEPMDEGGVPHLALGSHSPSHNGASSRHPHYPVISPTDERSRWHSHHQQMMHHQQQQHMHAMAQMGRPNLVQRHSMQATQPTQRPSVQRHHSLQVGTARSASPQIVGDIFDAPGNGSPIRRANSSLGFEVAPPPMELDEAVSHTSLTQFLAYIQYFNNQEQPGITPSRALGPPPSHPFSFTNLATQPAVTPNDKRSIREEPSSAATSRTATSSSSSSSGFGTRVDSHESIDRRSYKASSEEVSPSRAASIARAAEPSSRPAVRPARSGVIGGRTSAKFSRVAVDPGVEGCPPGPRPTERPSPSFACIIGQAILAASAGGLSLDHIYRYVETVYPYFTPGEPAWRNSVRHNLSIHKMFETIPRTEEHPPGKGGIWVISEDERCHWPAPDKFVKNFPPAHPHHANCKQTIHEAEKEQALIDKAAADGTVYIPKKAKKVKKGTAKDKEEGADMVRTLSAEEMIRVLSTQSDLHMASSVAPRTLTPQMMHLPLPPQPSFDQGSSMAPPLRASSSFDGTMAPPRFGADKRRIEDDENVFGNSVKRVRLTQGIPLHPIDPDTKQFFQQDFITPERDRAAQFSSTNKMAQSSTAKTPALVNTSSSPGSSPMPPTVPRVTHNPSALHQGWTNDDIESSPARPPLGAAFDFESKPKAPRKPVAEEEFIPMGPPPSGLAPKTPVTRSSAHQKPRTPFDKTPFFGLASPMFPGLGGDLLDTPGWEAQGCIDRLGNCSTGTESPDGSRDMARYSLASNSGSPAKKRTIST